MFDFEPVTEINGWKGHQTALDLSQPRKLLGSAHPRLVSYEPGRERSRWNLPREHPITASSFSGANPIDGVADFANANSPFRIGPTDRPEPP
jgi:hypothetical protein